MPPSNYAISALLQHSFCNRGWTLSTPCYLGRAEL
jgi:hypothetical protein